MNETKRFYIFVNIYKTLTLCKLIFEYWRIIVNKILYLKTYKTNITSALLFKIFFSFIFDITYEAV